jgi:hypothetical protein
MKKIVVLLSLLLIPSLAIAQGYQIPYPAGTPRIENRTGASTQRANVTRYGDQQVVVTDGSGSIGGTAYSKISTADNNSTNIKASSGLVYSINACNTNAAARYLKLYNKATAPTCGTDIPALRVMIPATNCTQPIVVPFGLSFPLGIGICIVTGATDADNTSTAANEQTVNIAYK